MGNTTAGLDCSMNFASPENSVSVNSTYLWAFSTVRSSNGVFRTCVISLAVSFQQNLFIKLIRYRVLICGS